MVTFTRNSGYKSSWKGVNYSPEDDNAKIYWFPSLAHNVWTIQENFDDFNESNDFKDSKSYFDKFGALKRLLGPFYKNVGDFPKNVGLFPKNVGLFLRNLRRFFFYLLVFFVLELRWNNPLVWRLWKQKVQNPCNVRAWYAHDAHARSRTREVQLIFLLALPTRLCRFSSSLATIMQILAMNFTTARMYYIF